MFFRLFTCAALFITFWSLPLYSQTGAVTDLRDYSQQQIQTDFASVKLDGVELFQVRGIRSFPAQTRARKIEKRIVEIAKDPKISPDSIVIKPGPVFTTVQAGKIEIIKIVDADAALNNISRPVLAEVIMRVVGEAIQKYRQDRQPEKIRNGILLTVIATIILVAILFILAWVFKKLQKILKRKQDTSGERVLQWRSVEIVEVNRFWKGVSWIFSALRFIISFALLYIFLQFTFGQFPWTRFLSTRLLDLVVDPLRKIGGDILDYIPNLFFLIVLGTVVLLILKFIKSFFGSIERGTFTLPSFESEWARPTYRIIRIFVLIFGLVVAYPYIPGSNSAAFKGVSIFMGVLFSLGSSSAIANIIAGYSLIYRRAFKVGDRIQIGDVTGDVILMRLQATHLLTIKNETVTIPNSLILNSHVVNFSTLAKSQGLILHTTVGIGYEVSWRQVEAMLIRAAERTPGILKEPPPFVLQKSLDTFAVNYEINAYCQEPQRMVHIYTELHRKILDEFNEHGVQIMTPAYEGDPENPKVVPKSKWYAPPATESSKDLKETERDPSA